MTVEKQLIDKVESIRTTLHEISVYNLDVKTSLELYYELAKKVNEVINELSRFEGIVSDEVVEQNKKLIYLLGEGLKEQVGLKIDELITNGTMDSIINHKIFNDLNTKIDSFKQEVNEQFNTIAINVKNFGAVGDGVNDDTQSFISAIEYCKTNNYNKLFIPAGDYIIDSVGEQSDDVNVKYGKLLLPSNFTFEMNKNATLIVKPTDSHSYSCLTIVDSDNITIKGGTIIGEKNTHVGTTGEWGYGISIHHSSNIKIEDVNISNCWGDCINLRSSSTWVTPPKKDNENIVIKNCQLSDSRRQGISIESGINVMIDNCVIKNIKGTIPQSAIDIESNGKEITKNIKIINCTFDSNVNGICLWSAKDTIISNCVFVNNEEKNIKSIHQSNNVKITNCSFYDKPIEITFSNAHLNNNMFIDSNVMLLNPNYATGYYSNVDISNNTFFNSKIISFYEKKETNCDNVMISKNTFENENIDSIYLTYIKDINILDNIFKKSLSCVIILDCGNSNISNNKIYNTQKSAIFIGNTLNNKISNNFIDTFATNIESNDTDRFGILLVNSKYSQVTNNFISNTISTQRNISIKIDSDYCFVDFNVLISNNANSTGIIVSKDYNIITFNDLRNIGDTKLYANPDMTNNSISNNYGV